MCTQYYSLCMCCVCMSDCHSNQISTYISLGLSQSYYKSVGIVLCVLEIVCNSSQWKVLASNTCICIFENYCFTTVRRFMYCYDVLYRSVWSSLAPPTLPDITSQSYIFPTSIVTMTTTATFKGITPRSLLCMMSPLFLIHVLFELLIVHECSWAPDWPHFVDEERFLWPSKTHHTISTSDVRMM